MWTEALRRLEQRVKPSAFNTWLRPVLLETLRAAEAICRVPDDGFVYWLGEYYRRIIQQVLAEILGRDVEIKFQAVGEG